MAALNDIRSRKLHGYVLLESIVSMVIIMTCFGIAMLIFTTSLSGSVSKLRVEARIRLHAEAEICKAEQLFIDGDIRCEAYTIERKVKLMDDNEHLGILELRAFSPDGKVLAEHYELIRY